jgi:hypothetical protein
MKIFFLIIILYLIRCDIENCIDHCEEILRPKNLTSYYYCTNLKKTINVPLDPCFLSSCNITVAWPGTCECPNFCMEKSNQGKCINNRCICESGKLLLKFRLSRERLFKINKK